MTDADMDKVTAGAGIGNHWAFGQAILPANVANHGLGPAKASAS